MKWLMEYYNERRGGLSRYATARHPLGRGTRAPALEREARGAEEAGRRAVSLCGDAGRGSRAGGRARAGEHQVRWARGEYLALDPPLLGPSGGGVRRRVGRPHAP